MSQTFCSTSSDTPRARAPREEALAEVGQLQLPVLLGEDLPQPVRVLDGEAGEVDGHARDVLLVDHDAVGLGEGVLHQGVQRLVRGAVQALDEGRMYLFAAGRMMELAMTRFS